MNFPQLSLNWYQLSDSSVTGNKNSNIILILSLSCQEMRQSVRRGDTQLNFQSVCVFNMAKFEQEEEGKKSAVRAARQYYDIREKKEGFPHDEKVVF